MLSPRQESALRELCRRLIDQQAARVIVPSNRPADGYWFGGGNLVSGPEGELYLCGRYRNQGDSRTGLTQGTRGLELAVFRSIDRGQTFEKVLSFSKQDLSLPGQSVLSIEGVALRIRDTGVELFVSTEKQGVGLPAELETYLKPGTGVWSIDHLSAPDVQSLSGASVEPMVASHRPESIHLKDPFVYEPSSSADGNQARLFFCTHPFSWTCSNTGYLADGLSGEPVYEFFPRGNVWDVAMSRGTSMIDVPSVGAFEGQSIQLMFYDGGECVRNHHPHAHAVERPRGYSCEELGSAAYFVDHDWDRSTRLSITEPLFVSPDGTGCSRYVDVLRRPEGLYATWQQSQADCSQPLVMNFLPNSEVDVILGDAVNR